MPDVLRNDTALLQDASTFTLGLPGFELRDLYRPEGLRRLHHTFLEGLKASNAPLLQRYQEYALSGGRSLTGPAESALLIEVAAEVSRFVGKLFGLTAEQERVGAELRNELRLFEFKREFVTRRVFKKGQTDRPTAAEFPALHQRLGTMLELVSPFAKNDPERALAETVILLMHLERVFSGTYEVKGDAEPADVLRARWTELRARLLASAEGKAAFGSTLASHGDDAQELVAVRGLLSLADRWTYARALHPEGREATKGWSTVHLPKPLNFDHLVELEHPEAALPEASEGPPHELRRRDGFALTDRRGTPRTAMDNIDYCVICHEREKDSCSSGFIAKDPVAEGNTYKKNPLGTPLTGCPLDERISEMHTLKGRGDPVGALAMVMLDNPMCPGTGHRICNDCMKACIFQKQEPVNIPLVETSALTDVLELPFGFEIYGLFTRWNPLHVRRPYALPANGKSVLVVGLGPAGYTLAHYLLGEGFSVAGVDGLKIEPFPDALTGKNGHPLQPIRDFRALTRETDERVLAGFGGVQEYGITVRWDKNFLTLIHLTLARQEGFRIYGGIRFGSTFTLEDAWSLGFDHVALATGAGRPTIIGLKNNLIRGIRKASDFLMALQLTGAFKKDSLSNLQVTLPAIVIGGGLTAIDTATELMAYYPVQVERVLERHEQLEALGTRNLDANMDAEERTLYQTYLEHGRAVRAERERAKRLGELPDFIKLVRGWGGVAICYRRSLTESPAYRLNHEEVAKALEEGIRFIERMSPVEAHADEHGALRAVTFERMGMVDGKLKPTGERFELPARTLCVAAGTSPNVVYEREFPGTFKLDADGAFFQSHQLIEADDGSRTLVQAEEHEDIGKPSGFFTSYENAGRYVSFYGDNHPTYAGNVVKAMASAKDGYPEVVRAFANELASLNWGDAAAQRERDAKREALFSRLDESLLAHVVAVNRLAPTIVEVVVHAPLAARRFQPGQFYRLQNFEAHAKVVEGTKLAMEGLALTGAWVDRDKGLMGTIVLEMGSSSRLCATLAPGEPVVLMGPTGAPTHIAAGETVLLAGGGLGNAVLFSIGQALRSAGSKVLYFAAYRQHADMYKREELEAAADQIIWSVDTGELIEPGRPQDGAFRGNVVQAMVAYAKGEIPVPPLVDMKDVDRVIAIGSDRMMNAVKLARHGVLAPFLKQGHEAIGSINSPMQCMMKEICAQCLQKHVDPVSGKETVVFSCYNQDQKLDQVDFGNLASRLKGNSVLEKLSNRWLDHLFTKHPELKRV